MVDDQDDPELEEFARKLKPSLADRLLGRNRVPTTSSVSDEAVDYEAMLRGPGPVRRFASRHRGKLAIVAGLATIVWLGTHGSSCMIKRAEESDTGCSNRNYSEYPGASKSCAGRARLWLLIPRISPLHWRAARAADLELQHDEQERALTQATEVTLDPEARSAAIGALFELAQRPGWSADRRTTDLAFALTASSGDREAVAGHGDLAKGGFDRLRALSAAIGAGDLERAKVLARADDPDTHAYEYHMRRGALLCLTGSEKEGREALDRAITAYRVNIQSEYAEAQVGLLACGAPSGSQRQATYREAVLLADLLTGVDHLPLDRMLDPDGYSDARVYDNATPFLAAWLLQGEREVEEVLEVIGSLKPMGSLPFTPWDVGAPKVAGLLLSSMALAIDPERHERAAERLEILARSVEDGSAKVRPLELEGRDAEIRYSPIRRERAKLVREKALPLLRGAAQRLWIEAASARAGQFDRVGTMRDVDRAIAGLKPEGAQALGVASFAAWAGDEARALRELEAASAWEEPEVRLLAGLGMALVHMHAGRVEQAHAAALRARDEVEKSKGRVANGVLADDVRSFYERSVGWVLLAPSLRLGKPEPFLKIATPKLYEREDTDWATLAAAPDDVRRDARFRMQSVDFGAAEMLTLPAVIHVLAHVARDGKSPDVWLDNALPIFTPRLNGTTGMRARAEAARWRGDTAAAARWDGLAESLERQFSSPKRAVLARLAGLD